MVKTKPKTVPPGSRLPAGNTRKEITGTPSQGKISQLAHGMGQGYIRTSGDRVIFFHRSDTEEDVFNALHVDDGVSFELIDDRVSGARAIRVRKTKKGDA